MNVDELLDLMEETLEEGTAMPFSAGKRVVDVDKMRDIIDDVRANLPDEMRQSKKIVDDRVAHHPGSPPGGGWHHQAGGGARQGPGLGAGDRQACPETCRGDSHHHPDPCPGDQQECHYILRDHPEKLGGDAGAQHCGHQEHPHESAQRHRQRHARQQVIARRESTDSPPVPTCVLNMKIYDPQRFSTAAGLFFMCRFGIIELRLWVVVDNRG